MFIIMMCVIAAKHGPIKCNKSLFFFRKRTLVFYTHENLNAYVRFSYHLFTSLALYLASNRPYSIAVPPPNTIAPNNPTSTLSQVHKVTARGRLKRNCHSAHVTCNLANGNVIKLRFRFRLFIMGYYV